jgi:hypothetical protein
MQTCKQTKKQKTKKKKKKKVLYQGELHEIATASSFEPTPDNRCQEEVPCTTSLYERAETSGRHRQQEHATCPVLSVSEVPEHAFRVPGYAYLEHQYEFCLSYSS